MKKLAIITLYDDINIGNKLQNLAVQYFFESFNMQCVTIPHWEMAHGKKNKKNLKLILIRFIGYPEASSKKLRLEKKRKKRFKAFSDLYLKLGSMVRICNLPKDLSEQYDYFVTGSDQVWHNWTRGSAELGYFFLQFAKEYQRLTISPSFGKHAIEPEFLNDYVQGLNGIPVITCREKQGMLLVNQLTEKKAEVLLDPTMLICEENWIDIENKPKKTIPAKYVLVYALGEKTRQVQEFINRIAKEHRSEIIDIYTLNDSERYLTTPDEFLYYIHHAELVVTDSFHASVFSILYRTNFVVFDRKTSSMGNMASRLDTLLQTFNLLDRKMELCKEDNLYSTDFSCVEVRLDAERKRARKLYKETFELLDNIRISQKEG